MGRKKVLDRSALFDVLEVVADGIAGTFGSRCEVVLHDLRDLSCSIVKIVNSHITGRSAGGCMTDYGVMLLRQNKPGNLFLNYPTIAPDGRQMKSSTLLFRDDKNLPVASICINLDVDHIKRFASWLQEISESCEEGESATDPVETFQRDIDTTLEEAGRRVFDQLNLPATALKKKERLRIVAELENQGFFLIKGAVNFLARKLGISKFSVYSYLAEIQANSDQQNVSTPPGGET